MLSNYILLEAKTKILPVQNYCAHCTGLQVSNPRGYPLRILLVAAPEFRQRKRRWCNLLGSLSNNVFERRTSTGSDLFSFFDGGFAQIFSQIASIIVKKLRNTNFISSRHVKRENTSLPVDVRRSKTSLLKLPTVSPFPFSSERKIWPFHVVVVQKRQRNFQKAWCTCRVVILLILLFWRSRCCRRRSFVRNSQGRSELHNFNTYGKHQRSYDHIFY